MSYCRKTSLKGAISGSREGSIIGFIKGILEV